MIDAIGYDIHFRQRQFWVARQCEYFAVQFFTHGQRHVRVTGDSSRLMIVEYRIVNITGNTIRLQMLFQRIALCATNNIQMRYMVFARNDW